MEINCVSLELKEYERLKEIERNQRKVFVTRYIDFGGMGSYFYSPSKSYETEDAIITEMAAANTLLQATVDDLRKKNEFLKLNQKPEEKAKGASFGDRIHFLFTGRM